MRADSLPKLRAMLGALRTNPFYRERVPADVGSIGEFLERTPFTFKRELIEDQRVNPPFGSNLTFPIEQYTRFSQTNGTTGQPLRWLDTPENWEWMTGNWVRVFEAADVRAGERIFFAFSFGPFLGFWVAFDAAAKIGCMAIPGGGMRTDARVHAILDNRATVVCCTPTYAIRLGEAAVEHGIDLSRSAVRTIIVAGEPGGSIRATQTRIQELWRGSRNLLEKGTDNSVHGRTRTEQHGPTGGDRAVCPLFQQTLNVVDHHGMTEVGPVSYGCPKRERVLHVIESSYIAEVIDPATGSPAERGELVLTNLGRIGSPLIRYRTGDIVERGKDGQCECGTFDLALEGGILARTDDMVVVRGVNLYPSAVEDVLRACEGVAEYRVEIRTERALSELTVQVEASGDGDGLAHRLESALRNAFGLRVPVVVVQKGSLPRFEMKAQRWVRV